MKKILVFSLLVAVLFGNSGAGCSSKSDDLQPDSFQSLIGKWEIQSSVYNITEQKGTTFQDRVDYKARKINVVWEFFSDGRIIATQDGDSQEFRWKLTVAQLDGNDINDGKLTLIDEDLKDLARDIGQPGDLTYDIGTSSLNNIASMNLSLDVTKIGAYKQNILVYTLHKL